MEFAQAPNLPRVTSGMKGLDIILGGGYPKERNILVAGPAGAGKSTIGLAFLVAGIIEQDEPGIYVSFDETLDNVRNDALSYGWDLKSLEDQNLLAMIDGFSPRAGISSDEKYVCSIEIDEMINLLINLIDSIGAERVVVDSITAIAVGIDDEVTQRKEILKLSAVMSALTCTTIMVSEMRTQDEVSTMGVEEFMTQGVITLRYQFGQSGRRSIQVRKMRGVKHSLKERPFLITDQGPQVYPDEELYEFKSN
ncbi:MAG: circadian clock protein KaiC [Candidatus Heimdallarchaeota archaeon]|nr:circadian clock protein KaiC [Candidatus Heimdallarchaeota archaeon]MDH5647447.1 circadian clock protein KaiC [Candidatus Heimdallarchaeota archaeon]